MLCIRRLTTAGTWCRLPKVLQRIITQTANFKISKGRLKLQPACLVSSLSHHLCTTCQIPVRNCSTEITPELSEFEYERLANETLDSLTEKFEDLPDRLTSCDPEYDVTFGSGVLTVKVSESWGTYVINKQSPNKQIWLSSPQSGPKRYDFTDGVWLYKHDGNTMHDLLTKEISEALGEDIDFTICAYGNR